MPTSTTSDKKAIKLLKGAGALAFWLLVWWLAASRVGQELLIPSPASVWAAFKTLCTTSVFWASAGYSMLRIFSGFAAGVVLGTVLGALTAVSKLADALLSPAVRVVRATPVASFIILALLWIGHAVAPAFIAMLMVMPVVWGNVRTGIAETSPELLEMAKAYRFGALRTLRMVYVPSVLPLFSTGCVTALGLAWKSGIAAEVLSLPRLSIGTRLYYSKIYLETPSLFVWTILVVLLSMALEKLIVLLIRRLTRRLSR